MYATADAISEVIKKMPLCYGDIFIIFIGLFPGLRILIVKTEELAEIFTPQTISLTVNHSLAELPYDYKAIIHLFSIY